MKIIKKILSLSISVLGVLLMSGFLSLQPIGGLQTGPGAAGSDPALAHHEPAHACNDVSGVTAGVPSPQGSGRNQGVEDSGRLDFNADPPAQSYQTCAERGQVGREDVWFLKGWTWNRNLGYISFYCDGGQNFGGDCSNQANPVNYETYLDSSGQVNGWAWGDNIGWISMTCRNGDNVGQNCGRDVGSSYSGVRITQDPAAEAATARRLDCNIAERGDFYGYAWSDSVGWLNFCGAHVELESPLTPEVTIETSNPAEEPGPGPGGCAENDMLCGSIDGGGGVGGAGAVSEGPVYANGSDFYKIVVKVKDGETTLDQAGLAAHGVSAVLTFDNKLRANQVTLCNPETPGSCVYNGAILPPSSLTPVAPHWDAEKQGLVAYIRAIAPTNYASDNNPLNDTDTLSLSEFNIVIDDIRYTQPLRSFEFRPAVAVTSINSGTPGTMEVIRGANPVYVTAARIPVPPGGDLINADSINIYTQLYDCSNEFDFRFDSNFNPENAETWSVDRDDSGVLGDIDSGVDDDDSHTNFNRPEQVCLAPEAVETSELGDIASGPFNDFSSPSKTLSLFADVQSADTDAPVGINIDNAFGFLTRVEYNAISPGAPLVRYFSLILPDQSLLNQAADVRGNVRIDIQKILREGAIAQSLKNNPKDTQSKREKFYRAIKNIINTKELTEDPDAEAGGIFYFGNSTSPTNGLRYFNTTNVPGAAPCKIILDDDETLSFGNNVTLVGEGCDFFIDQNIMANAVNAGRLGIIALEDLSLTGARRGGNVYICHSVTDVEANIVADGSIFALACGDDKDSLIDPVTGLPNDVSRATRGTAFYQLTIIGSIVSNNTYGGAFISPPILGDGTRVTNADQIPQARLYDMNFLRYAHTRPITAEEAEEFGLDESFICWDNTSNQLSKTFGSSPNCFNNNPGDPGIPRSGNGIVNIIYRAPAKDMKIFGAVR